MCVDEGRKRAVDRTRAESEVGMREGALQCWPLWDSSIQNMLSCFAPVTGFKSGVETEYLHDFDWEQFHSAPDTIYKLSRKILSPQICSNLSISFSLKLHSFNQQEMAASLFFAHYYQTKGSGNFAASEGFNYSKAVTAPVVHAPWIHLLLRRPVNDWL